MPFEGLKGLLAGRIKPAEVVKDLPADQQRKAAQMLAETHRELPPGAKVTPAGRKLLTDALEVLDQATDKLIEEHSEPLISDQEG